MKIGAFLLWGECRTKPNPIFGKISSVKTQIIQLEEHDDTISVKDKMDWSQTPRVLLVWPERGKVFRNRIDLVLLERYCSSHGSQLALLTKDPEVNFQAELAGIPVFQSRKSAQLQSWRKSFREFRRKELEGQAADPREFDFAEREGVIPRREIPTWGRILIFTVGVLAVLVIAGLLLPSAEVTILEEATWRDLVIPITANPAANKVNISGLIPARETLIVVEDQASRPTSGQIPIPDKYAQGEVVFTNLTDKTILIPENTILSTETENPILFVTLSSGTTPEGGGEQITILIRALEPGSSGNVDSYQINRINQEFGADLSVINPEPTTGGTDLLIPAPVQDDLDLLSISLMNELENSALKQVKGQLASEDLLLSSDPISIETIEEIFSPAKGSTGDKLTLTKRVQFGFSFVSGNDLLTLAKSAVNTLYMENENEPLTDSLTLTHLSPPELGSNQTYVWDLELKWKEKRTLNEQEIIQHVLGKKPAEAGAFLQEYLETQNPPVIKITPNWWFRFPAIPFRINITQEGS
jgi:hypothetical protein